MKSMKFILSFIVYWKGVVPPGRVIEDFISFPDVAPTFMEVAGYEWERGLSQTRKINVILIP